MGFYVNTPTDKIEWLKQNGKHVSKGADFDPETEVRVIACNNGAFWAAGIAFDDREYEAFTLPDDERDKMYFILSKEIASSVEPQYGKWLDRQESC